MRHKMMINEFIGRCSSNKGSELSHTPGAWRRRSTQLGVSLGAPECLQGFPHVSSLGCSASLEPRMLPVGGPGLQIQKWGWNPGVLVEESRF